MSNEAGLSNFKFVDAPRKETMNASHEGHYRRTLSTCNLRMLNHKDL